MTSRRKLACISTKNPISSITMDSGRGSLALFCPLTGQVETSIRLAGDMAEKVPLGVSSITTFPEHYASSGTLAIAFASSSKKDDSYALLLTLRPGSSSPVIHWKCRLPEARMTAGLLVSPCGNYIVGGSDSGVLYVWRSIGGALLAPPLSAGNAGGRP